MDRYLSGPINTCTRAFARCPISSSLVAQAIIAARFGEQVRGQTEGERRAQFLVLDSEVPYLANNLSTTGSRVTRLADLVTTKDPTLILASLTNLGLVPGNVSYQLIVLVHAGDLDATTAAAGFVAGAKAAGFLSGQITVLTIALANASAYSPTDLAAANAIINATETTATQLVIAVAVRKDYYAVAAEQWGSTIWSTNASVHVLAIQFESPRWDRPWDSLPRP